MKKVFWVGLLLILTCLVIVWLGWQLFFKLNSIWSKFYYFLIPWKLPSLANFILLSIFSLVCSGAFILLVGFLFSRRIRGKTLSDLLLKCFSQIPGIKSIVNLVSQIVEAAESIHKKQNKLVIYRAPEGRRILGLIKLKEIELADIDRPDSKEKTISFYEAFTPYIFSGRPYLVDKNRVYEIVNLSFSDYVKYVASGGLFFKLPKKLILRELKK